MEITRFGHSALLVQVAGKRLIIDPGMFSAAEVFSLTAIDAIIVTHQHADHLDETRIADLIAANPDALRLAPPDTAARFGAQAHSAGEVTSIGPVRIEGVGSEHAVIFGEIPRVHNTGALISAPGEPTLFHPGDSYAQIPQNVDILALPLSAPWTKVAETIEFARAIAPKTLFMIHDATISDLAYDIYFNHLANFSNCPDVRRIMPVQTAIFP